MRKYLYLALVCVVGSSLLPSPTFASCDTTALKPITYGQSGGSVAAVQSCLIEYGFSLPAGATGYYGRQTVAAVKSFYAQSLSMHAWHGQSVGPKGIAVLSQQSRVPASSHTNAFGYKRLSSAAELSRYVAEGTQQSAYRGMTVMSRESIANATSALAPTAIADNGAQVSAGRVSDTNVQVAGIDEPDIVKTDGSAIYISQEGGYWRTFGDPGMSMPRYDTKNAQTTVVDAFPVDTMRVASKAIPEHGDMLIARDEHMLVILAVPNIIAYDITDPDAPVKKWTYALGERTWLNTARLRNGTVYVVANTWINSGTPCPIVPLRMGASSITIPCGDIMVPNRVEPITHTVTTLAIDLVTGTVSKSLTFGVEGDATTVSMFENDLYIATKSYMTPYDAMQRAALEAYAPYVSTDALAHMQRIAQYDISAGGKFSEIMIAAQNDLALRTDSERMKVENEVENSMQRYLEVRKRELDRTHLTRIALDTLSIAATGEVPGSLVNQLALDEYDGHVRVAVTVNPLSGGNSANDVYVLNKELMTIGSVIDLGLGERVYAARFIGDTGYLVTFRQTDPFYVLDLKTPSAPKMVGQLKIPGYSAYLEPIDAHTVLGVGRDGGNVKASLFDVTNPAAPVEKSKYTLKESWTEVDGNHHAFLRDAEHQVFFLPGSQGGYVLSYANGTLALKATVSGWSIKRAVYLDDYLYIVGDSKIVALDEATWKEVKTLSL